MAESINIHFRVQDSDEVAKRIEDRFHNERVPPGFEVLVLVYPYDNFECEYEDSWLAEVRRVLGDGPLLSYIFEIRRSRSDDACDQLEPFLLRDLEGIGYVADNSIIITSRLTPDFLTPYRYAKRLPKNPVITKMSSTVDLSSPTSPIEGAKEMVRDLLRLPLLILLLAYGACVAFLSQASSPNYKVLAIVSANQLLFYLMAAALYLWIFRLRNWKILLAATIIIAAFVIELIVRTR